MKVSVLSSSRATIGNMTWNSIPRGNLSLGAEPTVNANKVIFDLSARLDFSRRTSMDDSFTDLRGSDGLCSAA